MCKFIAAAPGQKHTVIYTNSDGQKYEYSKGDPAWRNNNPGNLKSGDVSKRNNQIGKAGGFAIFPDYETDHAALLDCLRTTYKNATIEFLISKFAPDFENDTKNYLRFLVKKIEVTKDYKIKDLSSEQFEKLWQAIEKMEGPGKGIIKEIPKKLQITKVKKNKKGTIIAYFIVELGWISKQEGIRLAKKGKIDAVIATSRSGNLFLRTHRDVKVENNLDNLG